MSICRANQQTDELTSVLAACVCCSILSSLGVAVCCCSILLLLQLRGAASFPLLDHNVNLRWKCPALIERARVYVPPRGTWSGRSGHDSGDEGKANPRLTEGVSVKCVKVSLLVLEGPQVLGLGVAAEAPHDLLALDLAWACAPLIHTHTHQIPTESHCYFSVSGLVRRGGTKQKSVNSFKICVFLSFVRACVRACVCNVPKKTHVAWNTWFTQARAQQTDRRKLRRIGANQVLPLPPHQRFRIVGSLFCCGRQAGRRCRQTEFWGWTLRSRRRPSERKNVSYVCMYHLDWWIDLGRAREPG